MTPFELAVEKDLNIEADRFYNQWIFKWHGMTYEGGKTDVEDFKGSRIQLAGGQFGYSQQVIYSQAIDRYLLLKVHEIFQLWETETKGYSARTRLASITGVERALGRFVTTVTQRSLETAARLRNVSGTIVAAGQHHVGTPPGAEVMRLAQAHRALLEEEIKREAAALVPDGKAWVGWLEKFHKNNPGLIWFVGGVSAVVATSWTLWHFFFGCVLSIHCRWADRGGRSRRASGLRAAGRVRCPAGRDSAAKLAKA